MLLKFFINQVSSDYLFSYLLQGCLYFTCLFSILLLNGFFNQMKIAYELEICHPVQPFSTYFLEITRIWAFCLLILYVVRIKVASTLSLPFGVYTLMDSFIHLANNI